MPLSEFLRMARGKLESGQQKPSTADLPPRNEDDLVELVWENGQVMMRGQSSRPIRNPTNTHRIRDTPASRIGKFSGVESILNVTSPVVPSGDLDFSQDDEMVPWLNYAIDDDLPQDYGSGLLPEISGVTGNGMSTQNSFVSEVKRSSCNQTVSDLHNHGNPLKGSSSKALFSWPTHTLDMISNNTNNHSDAMYGTNSISMKMERQNNGLPANSSSFLNFSTFSRPATLPKANVPSSNGVSASLSSGLEKVEIKENGPGSGGSNPVKSTVIEPQKEIDFRVSSGMANSRQLVPVATKESCVPERVENLQRENSIKNEKPLVINNTANSAKGVLDGERTLEPMVASSSVGSGNSADIVSCEQTRNSKRKFRDTEESECRSDDIETESVGVKKPTAGRGGAGSKRSRAAEVHNLSERRRRDRINEKMRALQELIPNCNKADKASMLDEAIEYLKTLQLQVQIMSMGAGLCMPPMMLPTGMQHIHPAHLPHFSPMGMGMGFGMGMLDMHGGSPVFPVPPMQGSHFPCPMSGPTNFPRIPGSNIPLYGHPSQGIPSSAPRAPVIPSTGQLPVASAIGLSASRVGSQSEVPGTSSILNPEDPMTNKNPQLVCNAEASSSINHTSNQLKATNEVLVQSAVAQDNKQAADVNCAPALISTTETDTRQK